VRDVQRGLYFVRRETQSATGFTDRWTTDPSSAKKLSAEEAELLARELKSTTRQSYTVERA